MAKPPEPKIPLGIELSYYRAIRGVMREVGLIVRQEVTEGYPELVRAALATGARHDAEEPTPPEETPAPTFVLAGSWIYRLNQIVERITTRALDALRPVPFFVSEHARRTNSFALTEWKAQVRAAFGVDILANNPGLPELLASWEQANVDLITKLTDDQVASLRGLMRDAVIGGLNRRELSAQLQERLEISDKRARLIARDQIGKLNGNLQESRQVSAGVKQYIWRTVGDERVRATHRVKNGKVFDWAAKGEKPGIPVSCRCSAAPVWPKDLQITPIRN